MLPELLFADEEEQWGAHNKEDDDKGVEVEGSKLVEVVALF